MTSPALVKKADLKRMMAAVQESGYDSARIVIDPRTGKVNILLGPKAASNDDEEDFDL